ncbi:MAG TPA: glycine--tRNA ligase, partial [archaeon]|nr:glycine--tRNA ligase [archaeon]
FQSSGHLDSFADPVTYCLKCNTPFRADKLLEERTGKAFAEGAPTEHLDAEIRKLGIACGKCKGELAPVKKFNMMMKVDVGSTGSQPCFLRPEACQSIFLDFARLYKTMRVRLPFGVAQVGGAFRNEIAPRNQLLRMRELSQMDVEVFFDPRDADNFPAFTEVENESLPLMLPGEREAKSFTVRDAFSKKLFSGKLAAYYLARVFQFYKKLGIPGEKMRFRGLTKEERAFYSAETWDLEVQDLEGNWVELMACNNRTDYDLSTHGKGSKQDFSVRREPSGEKFTPHVFELSAGVDRSFYLALQHAFREDVKAGEAREWLSLPLALAPVQVSVFPLMKKDGLAEKAQAVRKALFDEGFDALYDESGSIGKRYARVDEIGCPYAVTIDYDTLKDDSVTIRERDSTKQERVSVKALASFLRERL